jgi:glucan phosphoethanolaminetransferase (alkaline phosphatase superfamily)
MVSPVQWKRALLGERPRALAFLLAPTLFGIVIDLVLRARLLFGWAPQGKAIYFSSLAISAAFWSLPLWLTARLYERSKVELGSRKKQLAARAAVIVIFAGWILPLATFCYGGQVLYHRVVHAYMGRDTVRLGFALRGTVKDWFTAWGNPFALVVMLATGVLVTIAIFMMVRRAAPLVDVKGRPPLIPAICFPITIFVFWIDMVDSRFLQAALPDDCFVHGFVHAVRVGITGKGRTRRGVSLRTPVALPPLVATGPKPNVLLVLTESMRADALCSERATWCSSRFLDEVVPDRIGLGKLTTPSPGTFGACVLLWTGLQANASVNDAHSAPVLWELAKAAGYRTAYITSQNLQFENFGAFIQRAGMDESKTAADLGGLRQEQLGAPDEKATAEMLRVLSEVPAGTPWFGVLHLSNTHAPYRIDPDLQPFEPHSTDPLGDFNAFHNHYRNSVLMQERTIAAFLREVRAMPRWEDTVVVLVADHGEQFRERGGLYHLHSLYDEEVRVPGFIVGGQRAFDPEKRAAVRSYNGHRTYLADVNATLVDLMGLGAARPTLPYANPEARSLVEKGGWRYEPVCLMSTATAVWDDDVVRNGVMLGEHLLVGSPGAGWSCFDIAHDPQETNPLPPDRCGRRMLGASEGFPPF